jgi:hypothetical protein
LFLLSNEFQQTLNDKRRNNIPPLRIANGSYRRYTVTPHFPHSLFIKFILRPFLGVIPDIFGNAGKILLIANDVIIEMFLPVKRDVANAANHFGAGGFVAPNNPGYRAGFWGQVGHELIFSWIGFHIGRLWFRFRCNYVIF